MTELPVCPDPEGCPVAVSRFTELHLTPGDLQIMVAKKDRCWDRVYDHADGSHTPNPGLGNTRFAPFPALPTGEMVPTMYLGETVTTALLETVFHNLSAAPPSPSFPRVVSGRDLREKLHVRLRPPRDLTLLDLRDPALITLELKRYAVASSDAEHYPCTRRIAQLVHNIASPPGPFDGVVWHSRQTEINELPQAEVAVVFCDRVPAARHDWSLCESDDPLGALTEGHGLAAVMQLADDLDFVLELNSLPDTD